MFFSKVPETTTVPTASVFTRRRKAIGTMTGLAVAAEAVPAAAQSPAPHAASAGHAAHHPYLSPLQVTSAY
ncbi:hypothetical protein OH779_39990 [Actinacidiphila glaucinigra]|uniref:hypothetical protein n=1 Tax=Actinacidiphila glaucinigra TaxID=235986 RepID=UPI00386F5453